MPIDDVVDLLERWRSVGGLKRSRVLVDGVRLVAGLTPEERRLVARSLSDAGAPGLAQAVAGRTGADADQLQDLTARLLDLDHRQLDHVIGSLTDPDERIRLVQEAVDRAFDPTVGAGHLPPAGAPVAGPGVPDRVQLRQEDLDALPPPGEAAREVGAVATPGSDLDLSGVAGLHAIALGEIPLDDPVLGDLALDHPELGEVGLGSTDLHDIGVHDIAVHEVGLADADGAPVRDAAGHAGAADADPDPADDEPHAADPDPDPADATATTEDERTTEDATGSEGTVAEEPTGATSVEQPAAPAATPSAPDPRRDRELLDRLVAATSAPQRFACLRDVPLDDLAPATSLALLDAVPAGWQRRRVATRLLDAGGLPTSRLEELFVRFPARADTVLLAGALVDAGAVAPDELARVLLPQDARRLAGRGGR